MYSTCRVTVLQQVACLFFVSSGPLDIDPSEDPTDGLLAFGAIAFVSAAAFGAGASALFGPVIADTIYSIPY